jgi:hypothetical protein
VHSRFGFPRTGAGMGKSQASFGTELRPENLSIAGASEEANNQRRKTG